VTQDYANKDLDWTICGAFPRGLNFKYPTIHGHRASPPHPLQDKIPPPGLFRWHYLQCVLKRFANDCYQDLDNIFFFELPLRMEGDSDDDGTGSEVEWPSIALDLGRNVENSLKECEEHNQAVAKWISTST